MSESAHDAPQKARVPLNNGAVLDGDEFFSLAENFSDLCWIAHADGHIFWYNRRWYEYTGTSPESQEGWGWQSVHDPKTLDSVIERWTASIATGEPFEMTFPLKGANGQFRQFLTRAVPKRNEKGAVVRWYGTNVDVSAQFEAENALRASERRFRTFTEAMPNQVWTASPDGLLDWFNSRVYEYFGVREGDLDGEKWAGVVHEDDLPRALQAWRTALSTGANYEAEFRLRRSDGIYRWHIARAIPFLDAQGAVTQWIGTNTDIQEQKQAEEALYQSERRLVLSQTAAGIASLEVDVATGTVIGSEGFWDLWGLSARDSVHISVLENLVVAEDRQVRSTPDTRRQGTAAPTVEYRIRRADTGELRWLWRGIDFVRDAAGKPIKMFGVMQDITERKTIEGTLRESEARYRSALTVGRMGSWETNFATGKRLWSPEAQALFGLSLPGGVGQIGGEHDEFRAALHPDDRYLVKSFHELADTTDHFSAEYRVLRPDGEVLWLSGRGQVFARDAAGRCQRLVNVVADVTEHKKVEEHVRFLLREMSHRSKNLLTVVQAIAGQTARTSASLEDFQKRFSERLLGLSASHDLLIEQNWHGAALSELVLRQLTPFVDQDTARVELSGPKIDLNANAAQALGLALHELATNAVKYGALSAPAGKVTVTWAVDDETGNGANLLLTWREEGGPPVEVPSRRGFGLEVISRIAPVSVSGTVALDFAETGICWTLTSPMSTLRAVP